MTAFWDVLGGVLVLVGVVFLLLGAVGVVRLRDVFARQHAGGKAATLGIASTLLGVAALLGETSSTVKLVLAVAFQLVAAPTATHALSRAAYRSGVHLWDRTAVDELDDALLAGDPERCPEDPPARGPAQR